MSIGLMLFIFLVVLLLISISSRENWRLSPDDPLNVDELKWPAAGYGSASVSLNCLFGAYSAMLLLIGYTCFAGIALGVVGGLVFLNRWIGEYTSLEKKTQFQSILYGLHAFESSALDRVFWMLIIFCQLGLAVAELVLLHHVFSVGLGFSGAHATVASLATSCVAYYYCLFGGYQAVFRTDALQYVFILLMGLAMLLLLLQGAVPLKGIDDVITIVAQTVSVEPAKQFMIDHPYWRTALELLGGFALGIMPIVAAPDAWKRVLIIRKSRYSQEQPSLSLKSLASPAPLRLLLAAALPLVLIVPLVLRFRASGIQDDWSFPIREIFALSPPLGDGFIILGMVAAFMSTFDGALMSATHVLMGQGVFPDWTGKSELARFRIILGLGFSLASLLLVALVSQLPNPYALGAILVVPFALASGILAGTSFGARRAKSVLIYLISPIILAWVFLALRYLTAQGTAEDPYLAVPLVLFGCFVFFLMAACSRIFSSNSRVHLHSRAGDNA